MNKRLLQLGGGVFTTLLIGSAIILTSYDQSTFTSETENSNTFLNANVAKAIDAATISFSPQGIEAAAATAVVTPKTNLTKLTSAIQYVTSPIIDPSAPRLETYISTSKLVYKPNDVIFIEVAVFDALKKTPYIPTKAQNTSGNNNQSQQIQSANPIQIQIAITNDQGLLLPNGIIQGTVNDTTASFAYKLPPNFGSGIVFITAGGSQPVPSQTYVLVQGPPPPPYDDSNNTFTDDSQPLPYNVSVRFFQQKYYPADFVSGSFKLAAMDPKTISNSFYSYSVSIPNSNPINVYQVPFDENSQGFFKFQLPQNISSSDTVFINITSYVNGDSFTALYAVPIIQRAIPLSVVTGPLNTTSISNGTNITNGTNTTTSQPIYLPQLQAKFVTESGSNLVVNASNKVYFYAFDMNSMQYANFNQGQVKEQTSQNKTYVSKNIKVQTQYNGLGSFYLTPKSNASYIIEIAFNGTNQTVQIPIIIDTIQSHIQDQQYIPNADYFPMDNYTYDNSTFNGTYMNGTNGSFGSNMTNGSDMSNFTNLNQSSNGTTNSSFLPLNNTFTPSNVSNSTINWSQPITNGSSTSTMISSQPEEILFGLSNRVVNNSESLVVRFQTNSYVNTSDAYVFMIKQKEKIIYTDIYYFQKNQAINVTIPATSFNIINGGTLYANLYKLTQDFWTYYNQTQNNTAGFCALDQTIYNSTAVMNQFIAIIQQQQQQQSTNQSVYSTASSTSTNTSSGMPDFSQLQPPLMSMNDFFKYYPLDCSSSQGCIFNFVPQCYGSFCTMIPCPSYQLSSFNNSGLSMNLTDIMNQTLMNLTGFMNQTQMILSDLLNATLMNYTNTMNSTYMNLTDLLNQTLMNYSNLLNATFMNATFMNGTYMNTTYMNSSFMNTSYFNNYNNYTYQPILGNCSTPVMDQYVDPSQMLNNSFCQGLMCMIPVCNNYSCYVFQCNNSSCQAIGTLYAPYIPSYMNQTDYLNLNGSNMTNFTYPPFMNGTNGSASNYSNWFPFGSNSSDNSSMNNNTLYWYYYYYYLYLSNGAFNNSTSNGTAGLNNTFLPLLNGTNNTSNGTFMNGTNNYTNNSMNNNTWQPIGNGSNTTNNSLPLNGSNSTNNSQFINGTNNTSQNNTNNTLLPIGSNITNNTNNTNGTYPPQNTTNNNTNSSKNGTNTTTGTNSTTSNSTNGTKPTNNTNNNSSINGTNNTNSSQTNNTIKCIQIDFNRVENFIQLKGSIQFFKKPVSQSIKVQIQTKTNKYLAGDLVEFNVTVINSTTGKPVTQDSYLNIFVGEDKPQIPGLNNYLVSFPGKVYMQNEDLDPEYDFLNPLQSIDYLYGQSNSSDVRLELYMATQMDKGLTYEMDSLKMINWMLPWASAQDVAMIQKAYGFNFNQGKQVFDLMNGDLSLDDSNDTSSNDNSTNTFDNSTAVPEFNIIMGGMGQQVPDFIYNNLYDNTTDFSDYEDNEDFMVGIDPNTKLWTHSLYQNYSRTASRDSSTDLLYGSGIRVINGTYKGSFRLSDLITNFKFQVNTYTANGALGSANYSIQTVQPFGFDFSIPSKMVVGDNYTFQVGIQNLNAFNLTVTLNASQIDSSLILDKSAFLPFVVPSNQTRFIKNFTITAVAKNQNAGLQLAITAVSSDKMNTFTGVFADTTKIQVKSMERNIFQSGEIVYGSQSVPSSAFVTLPLPDSNNLNSVDGMLVLYPSYLSYLVDGSQALQQNTKGTTLEELLSYIWSLGMYIEQLNLALNQSNGDAYINAKIIEATQNAQYAAQNLLQYQVFDTKKIPSGFEFLPNQTVGNEELTAFTLMIFSKMPYLNNTLNSTTQQAHMKWLLARRSNKQFPQNSLALDAKSRSPQNVTNAYIVSTLTATNFAAFGNLSTTNLTNETVQIITNAKANISSTSFKSDPYVLSLALIAAGNTNRISDALILATELVRYQNTTTGAFSVGLTPYVYTAFNTYGNDRIVETTAYAVAALKLANSNKTYDSAIQAASSWLKKQFQAGLFGSSFASVLALNAINSQQRTRAVNSTTSIQILKDGSPYAEIDYDDASQYYFPLRVMIDNSNKDLVANASTTFSIVAGNSSSGLNPYFGYAASIAFDDSKYNGSKANDTGLNFTVTPKYLNGTLGISKINTSMSYDLVLTNLDKVRNTGTVEITLRPSSCLTVDYGVLASLIKAGKIDYYSDNFDTDEVYLYIRGLTKAEARTVTVSFIQSQTSSKCQLRPFSAQFFKIQGSDVMVTAKF